MTLFCHFTFQFLQLVPLLRDSERAVPVPPQERQSQGLRTGVIPHRGAGITDLQGDQSGCSLGFVKTKVAFEYTG